MRSAFSLRVAHSCRLISPIVRAAEYRESLRNGSIMLSMLTSPFVYACIASTFFSDAVRAPFSRQLMVAGTIPRSRDS